MRTLLVKPEQHELIHKLYFEDNFSQGEIGKIIGVSQKCIHKLMKRLNWPIRTKQEAAKIKKYSVGLDHWRTEHKAWNKGLTQNHPIMRSLIDKGRETQIKNGKSKGSNNPMYGKVSTHAKTGYRKDLNHSVRSSWEANFARILNFLDLRYEYEKHTFPLKNGDTYTPDFFIPSKNKFYELKGWEITDKHYRFIEEYPQYTLKIIKRDRYNKYINKFSKFIDLNDNASLYTAEDIISLGTKWMNSNQGTMREFYKKYKISHRTITKFFGNKTTLTSIISC